MHHPVAPTCSSYSHRDIASCCGSRRPYSCQIMVVHLLSTMPGTHSLTNVVWTRCSEPICSSFIFGFPNNPCRKFQMQRFRRMRKPCTFFLFWGGHQNRTFAAKYVHSCQMWVDCHLRHSVQLLQMLMKPMRLGNSQRSMLFCRPPCIQNLRGLPEGAATPPPTRKQLSHKMG